MSRSERWLPVVGWEGDYEVSSLGRVRSCKRGKQRVLACHPDYFGYRSVTLVATGVRKTVQAKVHRLVARAFIGESDLTVNHKNSDKLDNAVSNLEYISSGDNTRHAIEAGVRDFRGENHWMNGKERPIPRKCGRWTHKLTTWHCDVAKALHDQGASFIVLARVFHVDRSTVSRAIRRVG